MAGPLNCRRSTVSGWRRLFRLVSPARYLAIVNVVNTGLGFFQGVVTARLLGPAAYGMIAVIAAIYSAVLNLLDVRLWDLAGKLYYRPVGLSEAAQRAYRASVLQVYVLGTVAISLAMCALGMLVNVVGIHAFTSAEVRPWWMAANGVFIAVNNLGGALLYQQRFSGRFYLMGSWRFVTQVIIVTAFLLVLWRQPTIDGYYLGSLVAAFLYLVFMAGVSVFIWVRHERFPILGKTAFASAKDYTGELRFLFMGNLLGYVKMFHRSTDTLLVGYFKDDRITGLYNLARSATDGLYVLFDALNQVYYPRFLELLSKRATGEYRRLARRMLGGASFLTIVFLVAEAVGLPLALRFALTDRFAGAEGAIMVLTVPFLFVTGFYTWLWPVFVHSGRLKGYTIASFAAIVAQYAVTVLLFALLRPSPTWAAIGYVVHYLVLIPWAVSLAREQQPGVIPVVPAPAAS